MCCKLIAYTVWSNGDTKLIGEGKDLLILDELHTFMGQVHILTCYFSEQFLLQTVISPNSFHYKKFISLICKSREAFWEKKLKTFGEMTKPFGEITTAAILWAQFSCAHNRNITLSRHHVDSDVTLTASIDFRVREMTLQN